jgi:hypothetical protein
MRRISIKPDMFYEGARRAKTQSACDNVPIEPSHRPNIFALFFIGHRGQIRSVPINILPYPLTLAHEP